ncbi:helix-turn-helix transcriptional regulator [Paenibacillus sepulcri]|uniref:Helix-turn-helix transcriptional regulator n=2 Tax=Paenibacillus sepulcri TaxID=359917 RepID=A0ABS7C1T1_9BACL|nr:helix-turn-helix transcriptional regulator [Paenibacillus sepulcri]
MKTLGEFLKSRRERLQPEQAGINFSYGRRRTPGLRREEAALLAGVSVTYYTWLEQGRDVAVSREVIESIAKALQLTEDERLHLIQLSSPHSSGPSVSMDAQINSEWQIIINQLTYPAFITNDRSEVLAWNQAANEIIADFAALPAQERVLIRLLFVDPELRRRLINWVEFARYSVGVYRTYYDNYAADPWYRETVEQLIMDSAEFAAMWERHDIQLKRVSRVLYQVPGAGERMYDINSFDSLNGNMNLHCCVYIPVESEEA